MRPDVNVLLFGEGGRASSSLLHYLEQSGCRCYIAASVEEALTLSEYHAFHLILSSRSLRETSRVLALCGESDCTGFFFLPVEDGGWWVPLMRHGQKCLGEPAARRSEFLGLLDELLREIESNELSELRVSNAQVS